MLRRSVPLVFLLLLALPLTARATTVRYVSLDDMARQSAFVFHGTVTAVAAHNLGTTDRPRIVTDVTFDVHRVLKGQTKGPQFTLRLIGGTVDGVTLTVPGTPRFGLGQEVVIFLEWTGQSYAINGLRQGLYQISRDATGTKTAQRSLEELCIMREDKEIEHRFQPEPARPLKELFDAIRRANEEVTR